MDCVSKRRRACQGSHLLVIVEPVDEEGLQDVGLVKVMFLLGYQVANQSEPL